MFSGSIVALITPFDAKGRVDKRALEKLVAWHIQEGTDGLVCCATTGEGSALSEREKRLVAEVCIQTAKKQIPVIVGTGLSGTELTVRLTEQMAKVGADGCLVVTPPYNKPSQRGCISHFREVAKVGLPVIVYHNPGRAAVRMTAEMIAELGKIPGVVALKESSHDLELIQKLRKLSGIPILSGEDDLTLETIRKGGVGACSVIGNVIPKAWKAVIQWALDGEWKKAETLANHCLQLCRALFLETNPQCVKFAMEWIGKAGGELRLPLVPVGAEIREKIKRAIVSLGFPLSYVVDEPKKSIPGFPTQL